MDITPAIQDSKKLIETYGVGRFRVSGKLYESGILICDEHVWPFLATDITALTLADFQPLLDLPERPQLVLLGTGAKQQFAPKELKQALRAEGITLEAMPSDSAARTYNVLLTESRRAAAALLPL